MATIIKPSYVKKGIHYKKFISRIKLMINLLFLFRSLCLETIFLFMTDPENCDFNYEYAKNSLEDSKCLISIGFLKSKGYRK